MIRKSKRWIKTKKRFVAFIDIMGFKEMVARNNHQTVLERMQRFRENVLDSIEREAERRLTSKGQTTDKSWRLFGESIIKPVMFSDSILLISNDATEESADYILFCVRRLLRTSLVEGIPIKGAIAYGQLTADFSKSLYLGMPLVDAYELQNELQLYGVILHHTFEQFINETERLDQFEQYSNIHKYPTPIKSGAVNHYIVGWFDDRPGNFDYITQISRLYNTVSGSPRRYVDNTLEFAEWLIKQYPQESSLINK